MAVQVSKCERDSEREKEKWRGTGEIESPKPRSNVQSLTGIAGNSGRFWEAYA